MTVVGDVVQQAWRSVKLLQARQGPVLDKVTVLHRGRKAGGQLR
jgi:hypothetical protein